MPIMILTDPQLRHSRYVILCCLGIFSAFISLGFGAIDIRFSELYQWLLSFLGGQSNIDAIHVRIIEELRLPRMILAFLTGAGLSLAGAVLQLVTRNPLADPYLFGISSGASFGAVLVIATLSGSSVFLAEQGLLQLGITGGAFLGSALSVMLVLAFAGNGMQIERMLLAGVAVSFMFASATSLVLYHIDANAVATLLFWTMGSFTRANWENLGLPIVIVSICLIIFLGFSRQMRTALAGDESAISLGVNIHKLRIYMLLLSSLMTATLVAHTGGIGFVGLMIPHIIRRVFHHHQRYFLASCVIFGGCFMVWVDVLARTLMHDSELPIGVITAAIGSIFFLLVLRQRTSMMILNKLSLTARQKVIGAFCTLVMLLTVSAYAEQAKPQKIIALSPHSVELLYLLGVGDKIVATTSFADYPEEAKNIPVIGGYNGIQIEKVLSLQPDLIVAWEGGNKLDDLDQLERLGLNVYRTKTESLTEIADEIRQLGRLVGLPEKANIEAENYLQGLSSLKKTYQHKQPIRFFYQLWSEPLRAMAAKSWINEMLVGCGGVNVFDETIGDYPQVSIENVLAEKPEMIIIPSHHGHGLGEGDVWSKWPEIPAC